MPDNTLQYEPIKIFHKREDLSEKYAIATEQKVLLENQKAIILAQEMLEVRKVQPKLPVSLLEKTALVSEKYKTHIKALAIASGEFIRAKGRVANMDSLDQGLRTMEVSTRNIK